jgi:hypothetical protein
MCTNALLLKEKLEEGLFKPSKYLTFSVHMDGQEENHDFAVCREGTFQKAIEGIRLAVKMGFRVTTNTTLFQGADPNSVRAFFDEMMELGVEGMMLSPGYAYDKAPDQTGFLQRRGTNELFEMILSNRKKGWRFNQSPLFLEYLMGKREYDCTPWGMPCYNVFGWQKPCYLLQEGYADTYRELLDEVDWSKYGHASGNPKCQLHGALGLRGHGGRSHLQRLRRHLGQHQGHRVQHVRESRGGAAPGSREGEAARTDRPPGAAWPGQGSRQDGRLNNLSLAGFAPSQARSSRHGIRSRHRLVPTLLARGVEDPPWTGSARVDAVCLAG